MPCSCLLLRRLPGRAGRPPLTRCAAAGENVDLYIPRKCSWTNRLITAKDHASIQINIGHLDDTGVYTGHYTTLALSGFVRAMVRASGPERRCRQEGLGFLAAEAPTCGLRPLAAGMLRRQAAQSSARILGAAPMLSGPQLARSVSRSAPQTLWRFSSLLRVR